MGRPAVFTSEQILDTAARLLAEGGPRSATVAAIAERLGAPTGSIYHRFESRDLLLARLWIRTAHRAQRGFLTAIERADVEKAAVEAALHLPRWSRANLDEARVMLLHRREDLAERWPDQLGSELATLNTAIVEAVEGFVRRRFGAVTKANMATVTFALLDVPYAAVRRYLLTGVPPPRDVDRLVTATCRCLLL